MRVQSRVLGWFRRKEIAKSRANACPNTEGKAFLDAYSEDTDRRVGEDPHRAVGGMWDEIGQLQFDYLRTHGLLPHHRMLDIGCGTLRGGRLFIRYLDPGHYAGIDISPKALDFAKALIEAEGLQEKAPHLKLNTNKNLKFDEFAGEKFDYVLAQSVFTHLLPEHIEECFAHLRAIMNQGATFCFTFKDAPSFEHKKDFTFAYPVAFFEELGIKNALVVTHHKDYPHPRGQSMAIARIAS
jgi:SAM-dependent methyltransferase